MSTIDSQLAELLGLNARLSHKQDVILDGQVMFLAGRADDPESFDAQGGKTGELGFYPVIDISGQTIYTPCLDRIRLAALDGIEPAVTAAQQQTAATLASFNTAGAAAITRVEEQAAAVLDPFNGELAKKADAASTATALGRRLRTDTASQNLSATEQQNVRTNANVPSKSEVTFLTKAAAQAATIDTNVVKKIRIRAWDDARRDGGSDWKFVASQPAHPGFFTTNGGTVFWEISNGPMDLFSLGARADQTVGGDAMDDKAIRDFLLIAKARGGAVLKPVPGYQYTLNNDLVIDADNITITSDNPSTTIFRLRNNAKIIVGTSSKVVSGFLLERINFLPNGDYSGPIITLVQTNNAIIRDIPRLHPTTQTGATVTHGIEVQRCQWTLIEGVNSQVNGHCIRLIYGSTAPNLEDHVTIRDCVSAAAKVAYNDPETGTLFTPAFLYIERAAGRAGATYNLTVDNNKYIKNMDTASGSDENAKAKFVLVNNKVTSTTNARFLIAARFANNMSEKCDIHYDFFSLNSSFDLSQIDIDSHASYRGECFVRGKSAAKLRVSVSGSLGLLSIPTHFSGCSLKISGSIEHEGMITATTDPWSNHTWPGNGTNFYTGTSTVSGVQTQVNVVLGATGSQAVGAAATSIAVTFPAPMSRAPDRVEAWGSWNMNFYATNITANGFTANFTAPGSAQTFSYRASVLSA